MSDGQKTHELKTDPAVFAAVLDGTKTYEIRKDDRGFGVGDCLVLRETASTGAEMASGASLEYTGRTITAAVTHLLRGPVYGLQDGWVILSLGSIWRPIETAPNNTNVLIAEPDDGLWIIVVANRWGGKWDGANDGMSMWPSHWRPLPAPPEE